MRGLAQHFQRNFQKTITRSGAACALLCTLIFAAAPGSQAQTYNVIHSFAGTRDGLYPLAGVTLDRAGNVYGTTYIGGAGTLCYENCGAAYKVAHKNSGWLTTPLYDFVGGNDGGNSEARLIIGPDGSLFGTTSQGGGIACNGLGCGTVFNLRPPARASANVFGDWTETVLYRFRGGSDAATPTAADLVFDADGNMYGTTLFGGGSTNCQDGCGAVYKLTPSGGGWTESVIYSFDQQAGGQQPWGGVIFDQDGNLYGATVGGGAHRMGTVYRLTPSASGWTERVLYSFQGPSDGSLPYSGLIFDRAGNLYGTTCCDGPGGSGTVWELSPGADWTFTLVYSFVGLSGQGPEGGVTMDAAGNLYGTTNEGGLYDFGTVFKLTPSASGWTLTTVYDFCPAGWPCTDGAIPAAGVTLDSAGNIYGTTSDGGATGGGVVFEITP